MKNNCKAVEKRISKETELKQLFKQLHSGDKKNDIPALLSKGDISKEYDKYFPGGLQEAIRNFAKDKTMAYRLIFICKLLMCKQKADYKAKIKFELHRLESKVNEYLGYKEFALKYVFLVFPANVQFIHDDKNKVVEINLGSQKKYTFSDGLIFTHFGTKELVTFTTKTSDANSDVKRIRIKKVATLNKNTKSTLTEIGNNTYELFLNGNLNMYLFNNIPNVVYYSEAAINKNSEYLLTFRDGMQIFFKKEKELDKDLGVYEIYTEMIEKFSKPIGVEGHKSIVHLQDNNIKSADKTKPTIASIMLPSGEIFETEVEIFFWKIQEQKLLDGGVYVGDYRSAEHLAKNLLEYSYEDLCSLYYFFHVYATFCDSPKLLRLLVNTKPEKSLAEILEDGLNILGGQDLIETKCSLSVIGIMRLLFSNERGINDAAITKLVEEKLKIESTGIGRPKEEHRQIVLKSLLAKIEEHNKANPEREFHEIYDKRLMSYKHLFAQKDSQELMLLKIILVFILMNDDNRRKFRYDTSFLPLDVNVAREMNEELGAQSLVFTDLNG